MLTKFIYFMRFKLIIFFTLGYILCSCESSNRKMRVSLDSYKIEAGFELKVIASEPLFKDLEKKTQLVVF